MMVGGLISGKLPLNNSEMTILRSTHSVGTRLKSDFRHTFISQIICFFVAWAT